MNPSSTTPPGYKVTYKALVRRLEKELCISFTTTEDPLKVKRKLSMAKHREGIEGKLIFSHSTAPSPEGEASSAVVISVVLAPKASELSILSLNTGKEHSL